MAISDTITSMQNHLKSAYEKVSEKGGTVPSEKNMANLSEAIDSVSQQLDSILENTATNLISYATLLATGALYNRGHLISVNLPKVKNIGVISFQSCTSLKELNVPLLERIQRSAFWVDTGIEKIDLPSITYIERQAFYGCTALKTIIIRPSLICGIESSNIFENTPISTSTTEGFIYVPDDLVDSYKSATNWSTYASKIKPISDLGE